MDTNAVMNAVSWDQFSRFRRGVLWTPRSFKLEAVWRYNEGMAFRVRGETGSYNVCVRQTVTCSCPDPFAGLCKHVCWVVFKVLRYGDLDVFRTRMVPMVRVWHFTRDEATRARLVEVWGRSTGSNFQGLPDRELSLVGWASSKGCPFLQTEPWPPVNLECAVCFEDMDQEKARQCPGCSNSFHDICISQWFKQKRSCPLCRKVFDGTV